MSRSSDLALLIADRERQFGAMDDKQRRDFAVMYAKDRLPHQRKGGRFPADDEQPSTFLTNQRLQPMRKLKLFLILITTMLFLASCASSGFTSCKKTNKIMSKRHGSSWK